MKKHELNLNNRVFDAIINETKRIELRASSDEKNYNDFKVNDRKLELYYERQKIINNKDFPDDLTIISNTCLGGRLYHDYHHKFLSPTIDFYMKPDDFVKFCLNLKHYLNCDLKPLPELKYDYLKKFLFCELDDLIACFGHTNDSYEKIIKKWNERKKRVNYENIVILCTDRNVLTTPFTKCSKDTIIEFGKIPYKKVMFSVKEYHYDYVAYLPSFNNETACPEATRPSALKSGKYIVEEDGFNLDRFICKR